MYLQKLSFAGIVAILGLLAALWGCATVNYTESPAESMLVSKSESYLIGPGDELQIFVWRNEDLSMNLPVRPDGRISIPLIDDIQAAGEKPTDLGKNIEAALAPYVREPLVTVIVTRFLGKYAEQIRMIGAGIVQPTAIPYRDGMTLLDAVIAVGGLNEFAAGNKAKIWRGNNNVFRVRLDDLLQDGDLSANVALAPGDIIIVPQSWF